ncbi:hypothetical protein CSAL01_01492 [Colletotrichum salicis]|uniref:Uncharacterized protein n=1 Tax=Colletotrichum salicis TaxID=1209931 RepID=A0A135V4W6_9PEZI|nr:hypothetical protein CSAL01_01492 [Colletotrichum salicis]
MWQPSRVDYARALLSQGLDRKMVTFEAMSRKVRRALLCWDALREKTVPWSHDSLTLTVEKFPEEEWFYGTSRDSHRNTWAADFIDSWTLLAKRNLAALKISSPEKILLGGKDSGLKGSQCGQNWPAVTEARLLPLEEAFTHINDTYDEEMENVPWEDVRII